MVGRDCVLITAELLINVAPCSTRRGQRIADAKKLRPSRVAVRIRIRFLQLHVPERHYSIVLILMANMSDEAPLIEMPFLR